MWRTVVDAVEARATPRVDGVLRSEAFARAISVGVRVEAGVKRKADRLLHRFWRTWNLPSATDISRMSNRISRLERQIADLAEDDADSGGGPP
jgi:hypothetical protein